MSLITCETEFFHLSSSSFMSLVIAYSISVAKENFFFFQERDKVHGNFFFLVFIRHFSPFAKVFKIMLLSLSPCVCTDDICNYSASCRISLRRIQLQGWTGDSVNCLLFARWQQLTYIWRESTQRAAYDIEKLC